MKITRENVDLLKGFGLIYTNGLNKEIQCYVADVSFEKGITLINVFDDADMAFCVNKEIELPQYDGLSEEVFDDYLSELFTFIFNEGHCSCKIDGEIANKYFEFTATIGSPVTCAFG